MHFRAIFLRGDLQMCIFFELMTRYSTFLCYLCGRIRCSGCNRADDNGWQMSNPLNNTIMENIIALLFVLGEVALYIYLLIALCSYWIALSCLQSANSAMSLALQLSQKFHVTKLTKLTRTWSKCLVLKKVTHHKKFACQFGQFLLSGHWSIQLL